MLIHLLFFVVSNIFTPNGYKRGLSKDKNAKIFSSYLMGFILFIVGIILYRFHWGDLRPLSLVRSHFQLSLMQSLLFLLIAQGKVLILFQLCLITIILKQSVCFYLWAQSLSFLLHTILLLLSVQFSSLLPSLLWNEFRGTFSAAHVKVP